LLVDEDGIRTRAHNDLLTVMLQTVGIPAMAFPPKNFKKFGENPQGDRRTIGRGKQSGG
jgi:hypothetical protein